MAKRKAEDDGEGGGVGVGVAAGEPRRSSRRKQTAAPLTAQSPDVKSTEKIEKPAPAKRPQKKQPRKKEQKEPAPPPEEVNGIKKKDLVEEEDTKPLKASSSTISRKPAAPKATAAPSKDDGSTTRTRQYWLMKAEPESRLERGHDIKFSIDDLASRTVPEPWDGIRAYSARNNLRAMKKGDLAFFYHSSCKIPAIVGIMEIVAEHTPDLSAHDPSAPYHDPNSQPDNPKWSLVHVEFRQKLKTPITLKELRAYAELQEMQMLRGARLSVSNVREAEWRFLLAEMEKRGDVVDL